MQTVTLGRTGLEVTIAGMGAGGSSRLGQKSGATPEQAADVVRAALDLGVNFVDTAPAYGTEPAVGLALKGRRDRVVLSSKVAYSTGGFGRGDLVDRATFRQSVDDSLKALQTDHIDILHLHGVRPEYYEACCTEFLPELTKMREAGKIRFLGVTESFGPDRDHAMLRQAIADGHWDVVMLGLNMVNPSVTQTILPATQANNIGTLCMFAVRGALVRKDDVKELVDTLIATGEVDADAVDAADPLGFLLDDGVAQSLTEAAYRFCRHTPGIDVVLTGTGNIEHLTQNVAAIEAPPLPPAVVQRLASIFGRVQSATGDLPKR